MNTQKHVLYRFYGVDDALLYIGITARPMQRFRAHQKMQTWWTEVRHIGVENFPTRADLVIGERQAIIAERPKYNITHNTAPEQPKDLGRTYSLAQVAEMVLPKDFKDPIRWLKSRLKRGEISGYLVGRTWRMTESDVKDLVDRHSNTPTAPQQVSPSSDRPLRVIDGLSARSRRRLERSA
jgi:hypothetical protein